jgi:hypothetical protein
VKKRFIVILIFSYISIFLFPMDAYPQSNDPEEYIEIFGIKVPIEFFLESKFNELQNTHINEYWTLGDLYQAETDPAAKQRIWDRAYALHNQLIQDIENFALLAEEGFVNTEANRRLLESYVQQLRAGQRYADMNAIACLGYVDIFGEEFGVPPHSFDNPSLLWPDEVDSTTETQPPPEPTPEAAPTPQTPPPTPILRVPTTPTTPPQQQPLTRVPPTSTTPTRTPPPSPPQRQYIGGLVGAGSFVAPTLPSQDATGQVGGLTGFSVYQTSLINPTGPPPQYVGGLVGAQAPSAPSGTVPSSISEAMEIIEQYSPGMADRLSFLFQLRNEMEEKNKLLEEAQQKGDQELEKVLMEELNSLQIRWLMETSDLANQMISDPEVTSTGFGMDGLERFIINTSGLLSSGEVTIGPTTPQAPPQSPSVAAPAIIAGNLFGAIAVTGTVTVNGSPGPDVPALWGEADPGDVDLNALIEEKQEEVQQLQAQYTAMEQQLAQITDPAERDRLQKEMMDINGQIHTGMIQIHEAMQMRDTIIETGQDGTANITVGQGNNTNGIITIGPNSKVALQPQGNVTMGLYNGSCSVIGGGKNLNIITPHANISGRNATWSVYVGGNMTNVYAHSGRIFTNSVSIMENYNRSFYIGLEPGPQKLTNPQEIVNDYIHTAYANFTYNISGNIMNAIGCSNTPFIMATIGPAGQSATMKINNNLNLHQENIKDIQNDQILQNRFDAPSGVEPDI